MSSTRGNHPDGSEGPAVVILHPNNAHRQAPPPETPAAGLDAGASGPSPPPVVTTLVVQASPAAASDDEAIFKLQVQLDMQRERALLYRVSAAVLGVAAMMILREWMILLLV